MPRYTNSFLTIALAYAATLIAAQAPTPTYTNVYTPIPIDDDTPIYSPTVPSPSASKIPTFQIDTIILPPLTPSLTPTSFSIPAVPTPSGGFGNATSTLTGTALMPVVTGGAVGRTGMGMGIGMGFFVAGVVGGFLV